MRKHVPHPVTLLSSPYAELDLLYGGNESEAMEESMKIACDLRDVLRDGEDILYVNTLVSELRMAYAMGKRFDHGARRGRNYFVTYSSGELIDKLKPIRSMCEYRKYKYLVINGFELAALTTRHRTEFMAWLRLMRNLGINVILFTVSQPKSFGALGSLRYSARSVEAVGAHLEKANGQRYENYESSSTEENAVEIEQEVVVEAEVEPTASIEELATEDQPATHEAIAMEESTFADEQEAMKLFTNEPLLEDAFELATAEHSEEHSDSDLLKTKDLALEYV